MSYEQLKSDALQARKNRETVKATLLNTVLAQIKTRAIDDSHREPNDNDVLVVVRQFVKASNENIDLAQKNGESLESERVQEFLQEKQWLEIYLPQQMTEEELRKAITKLNASHIGEVMKNLQKEYAGRYDGKLASQLAKEILG